MVDFRCTPDICLYYLSIGRKTSTQRRWRLASADASQQGFTLTAYQNFVMTCSSSRCRQKKSAIHLDGSPRHCALSRAALCARLDHLAERLNYFHYRGKRKIA